MDISSKIKSGIKNNLFEHLLRQGINQASFIILARLLLPADYGLIAMLGIFISLANIFLDFGFSGAIIYFKHLTNKGYSSIFWVNLIIGIALFLIFFVSSNPIAVFFKQPELENICKVLSITFILNAMVLVNQSLLRKKMRFNIIRNFEVGALVISSVVGVFLAYNSYGVWSLVYKELLNKVILVLLYWFGSPVKISFVLDWTIINKVSSYSRNYLGGNLLAYFTKNTDNFIIAKLLGDKDLGLYTRAYSFMLLPMTNITYFINKVIFPGFSKLKEDKIQIKAMYLKILTYTALLSFPMMFGLFAVADIFTRVVLGPNWMGMVPILQILCCAGVLLSLQAYTGSLFNALGDVRSSLILNLIFNVILIVGFLIGIYVNGIIGLSYAYCIVCILKFFPMFYYSSRLVGITFVDLFFNIRYIVFATFLMTAALLYMRTIGLVISDLGLINLTGYTLTGFAIYMMCLLLLDKNILLDMKKIMRKKI